MGKPDRKKIIIDKEKEMRTKEISTMINEGGLGAENYYNIEKTDEKHDKETKSSKDEK